MSWTTRDEKRHAELQAELQKLEARREDARLRVEAVIAKCYDRDHEGTSVDLLIQYADDMRDALAPFDSGIRVEQKE